MIRASLPPAPGIGFKPQHFDAILAGEQPIGFVEVHAENYMGAGGPPHAMLRRTARALRAVDPRRRIVDRIGGCRSIPIISPASKRYATATSRPVFPSISPGRRMATSISTICCRCPIRPRRSTASFAHIDQVQHTLASRNAAGEPVDLSAIRRQHDPGNRIPRGDRAPHRLRSAARRQQRVRAGRQSRHHRRRPISPPSRSRM